MQYALFVCFLVLHQGFSRTLPEEDSVVSVYTTLPTATNASEHHLDVYGLIANNIAERITSPIYRFLGINRTTTAIPKTTTKRPFSKIEILDDSQDDTFKPDLKPVDNAISKEKDVEELSVDALKRIDKKPEKITLYSSYLPVKITEKNASSNEVDEIETFGFDDDDVDDGESETTPREGPLIFILELIGSFFQLISGGLASLFTPKSK